MTSNPLRMKALWALPFIGTLLFALFWSEPAPAADRSNETAIQAFVKQEERAKLSQIEKQQAEIRKQHQILFLMGLLLLISMLTTAGLGIAMGIYGKPVFVAHMVFAGLSVTLAIVHAVVAVVWFYPF